MIKDNKLLQKISITKPNEYTISDNLLYDYFLNISYFLIMRYDFLCVRF